MGERADRRRHGRRRARRGSRAGSSDGVDLDHLETGRADRDGGRAAGRSPTSISGRGRSPRRWRPGRGSCITGRVADASLTLGPGVRPLRLGLGRLGAAGRGVGRRPSHRVRRPGDRRALARLGRAPRPRRRSAIRSPRSPPTARRVITKPEGTGGLVSVGTVTEQIVYEIDDPARYRTPDVDVDFTTVVARAGGPDRVAVRGRDRAGRRRTGSRWRRSIATAGRPAACSRWSDADAEAKARAAGRDRSSSGCAGRGSRWPIRWSNASAPATSCPGVLRPAAPPFEVVLRVTVRDPDRAAVERFCREFAPLVTAGPPGIAGYATGRPSPRPAFGYWPALVPRDAGRAAASRSGRPTEWAARRRPPRRERSH